LAAGSAAAVEARKTVSRKRQRSGSGERPLTGDATIIPPLFMKNDGLVFVLFLLNYSFFLSLCFFIDAVLFWSLTHKRSLLAFLSFSFSDSYYLCGRKAARGEVLLPIGSHLEDGGEEEKSRSIPLGQRKSSLII